MEAAKKRAEEAAKRKAAREKMRQEAKKRAEEAAKQKAAQKKRMQEMAERQREKAEKAAKVAADARRAADELKRRQEASDQRRAVTRKGGGLLSRIGNWLEGEAHAEPVKTHIPDAQVPAPPAVPTEDAGLWVGGQKLTKQSEFYRKHAKTRVRKEILDALIASQNQPSTDEAALEFELTGRSNILRAAEQLAASRLSFPKGTGGIQVEGTNLKLWEIDRAVKGIRLKAGSNPADGIRELWRAAMTGTLTAECANAANLVWYKGALDTIGDPAFNELYNVSSESKRYEIRIGSGSNATQPLPSLVRSPVPGDIMNFVNPNVTKGEEEWGFENVVVLSTVRDRYYGHGIGTEKKTTILRHLNRHSSKGGASLHPQAKQVYWKYLYDQVHRK